MDKLTVENNETAQAIASSQLLLRNARLKAEWIVKSAEEQAASRLAELEEEIAAVVSRERLRVFAEMEAERLLSLEQNAQLIIELAFSIADRVTAQAIKLGQWDLRNLIEQSLESLGLKEGKADPAEACLKLNPKDLQELINLWPEVESHFSLKPDAQQRAGCAVLTLRSFCLEINPEEHIAQIRSLLSAQSEFKLKLQAALNEALKAKA